MKKKVIDVKDLKENIKDSLNHFKCRFNDDLTKEEQQYYLGRIESLERILELSTIKKELGGLYQKVVIG